MNLSPVSSDIYGMNKPPKILIILHQEHSTPGRVGQALLARGYELDIRKPRFGDPLPSTMDDHAAAVVFGGPMSANDNENYIAVETDWISVPLKEEKPFLGICLGAQMLVRHLGGHVRSHPEGKVEIGYYELEATKRGRQLMPWPRIVYQWHTESMDVPTGSVELARSETFATQAIQVGPNAFGIQFHTELTLAMLYKWTTRGAPRLELPGAQPRAEHFKGRLVHDPAIRCWLNQFLDLWLSQGLQHRNTASNPPGVMVDSIAASPAR